MNQELLPAVTGRDQRDFHLSELLEQLDGATLFDLYRLNTAIDRWLSDPERIERVRRRIRVGEVIEYLDPTDNRCIPARVLRCNRARVVVQNLDDGNRWQIGYAAINTAAVDTTIHERVEKGLGRNEVGVGDRVGFVDRHNRQRHGTVTRLNAKTVTLRCPSLNEPGRSEKWRVAYSLLFRILEGQSQQHPATLIESHL